MKNDISQINKGLDLDNSVLNKEEGTHSFALNAVLGSREGGMGTLSNEESNEIVAHLKKGYRPNGKIYMSDGRSVITSTNDKDSEIGILDSSDRYTEVVNDSDSIKEDKLGFKVSNQIQGVYRVRRGCGDTIYFTDFNQKPRYFNFGSTKDFKNNDGTWNQKLFDLQKTYSKVPGFQDLQVLNSGGSIPPGSVNVSVQYVDSDLNATEFIKSSPVLRIYNDPLTKNYRDIEGSINSDAEFQNFPNTSKSIRIELSNLDKDYLYYRLAFISANNGSGLVNKITYSEVISTDNNVFVYTGENINGEGTEEEIAQYNDIIEKCKTIDQIENKLLLGNTEGNQIDYCQLQRYASKIQSDCVERPVNLSNVNDPLNPKNPSVDFNGTGLMPGEMYSYGVVYEIDGHILSPVFHIPGKPREDKETTIYSYDEGVHPMAKNNFTESFYTDSSDCIDYWGHDCNGNSLKGKKVRHHRIPYRSKIGLPLVEKTGESENEFSNYQLKLSISGDLLTPVNCPEDEPNCPDGDRPAFEVRVNYSVDGQSQYFTLVIDPSTYSTGERSYRSSFEEYSKYHSSNNIEVQSVEITDINGNYQTISEGNALSFGYNNDVSKYFDGAADFNFSTNSNSFSSKERGYRTKILGIKFSNIEKPDIVGGKVTGYYIVRNERKDFDKSIVDSGVLVPTTKNDKYVSQGLLKPDLDPEKISDKNIYGLINPEHKFNGKELVEYDRLVQEGTFVVKDQKYGKFSYNDVKEGSSISDKDKDNNDDGAPEDGQPRSGGLDGFSLEVITRDNIVEFKKESGFFLPKDYLKDRFYLNALENKSMDEGKTEVYNISADNKIGIVRVKSGVDIPINRGFPYVILEKRNPTAYYDFRTRPYYFQNQSPARFASEGKSEISVFSGDTFISPMRYVNTMFWDNRIAKRKGRTSALKTIGGFLLAAAGGVLLATGALSALGAVAVGAGISIIGGGVLLANSGLKLANFNKAYEEEYEKGLKDTVLDKWVDALYNYRGDGDPNGIRYVKNIFGLTGQNKKPESYEQYGTTGPSDDTIQWIGESITDLWFESPINISLRIGMSNDTPTFLNAPGKIENGNDTNIKVREYFGYYYQNSNQKRYPISALERHLDKKLLAFSQDNNDNRHYLGGPLGEYYAINPDYQRENHQKFLFHLPKEYDCCTDCRERFPQRWRWSEESFQEELTDNYRTFLPNNYKDLQGDTGPITNMFTINEHLYIHTQEALYSVPRNQQERVTGEIVSFVGTGEYGQIPARKIVDSENGMSAGLLHRESALLTPNGYFFISENQSTVYGFNGKSLEPISYRGANSWFKENIQVNFDRDYLYRNHKKYPFSDNPSNKLGTGFVSTYDSRYKRLLFSKKDFVSDSLLKLGDGLCVNDQGQTIAFENLEDIIREQKNLGWRYVGKDNCKLRFEKTFFKEKEVTRTRRVKTTIPPETVVIPFFDTTSMNSSTIENISQTISDWFPGFKSSVNNGNNQMELINPNNSNDDFNRWGDENWLKTVPQLALDRVGPNKKVLLLVFVDESEGGPGDGGDFHSGSFISPIEQPTQDYENSYNEFINTIYQQFDSFTAINYPIVRDQGTCKNYLQHAIAAIEGKDMTLSQVNELDKNPYFTQEEWEELKLNLQNNPYKVYQPLRDYGWLYKENRADKKGLNSTPECPSQTDSIISPCQFTLDIDEVLESSTVFENKSFTETVQESYTQIKYITGKVVDLDSIEQQDRSWTLSYSFLSKKWISWHSYLPSFYIGLSDRFYSWTEGRQSIFKHNKKGHYQVFYENFYPHIIEYIAFSRPLVTKVWNHLRFMTRAYKHDEDRQQYFEKALRTFNKAVLYNTSQTTGLIDLKVKDNYENPQENYLLDQVSNFDQGSVTIDKNERDWTLNNLRDIRTNYDTPIWNSNPQAIQHLYFIDKVLNEVGIDPDKNWDELQTLRDKYLTVRLIFDKFVDTKLVTDFIVDNNQNSTR